MAKYLITLTPQEPWFFGGERVFERPEGEKSSRPKTKTAGYFIRSEDTPSQTTLFGALRYLMHSTKDWQPDASVGPASYDLTHDPKKPQKFGNITSISPLYLLEGKDRFYIPTPMDHKIPEDRPDVTLYSPFVSYPTEPIHTNHGPRCYPKGYDEKQGSGGGWLCLKDRKVYTDLFEGVEQVGVAVKESQDGFFKRECKRFKYDGFCFAFFAEFKEEYKGWHGPQQVFLGQRRCAFSAACKEQNEPKFTLDHNLAYAQSPIYIADPQKLYGCCSFVCVKQIMGYRKFTTSGRGFHVAPELLQLIAPGSVFLLKDPKAKEAFEDLIKNEQAETAGFNKVIYGKELSE